MSIIINGTTISSGKNIIIRNNKVIIDGKDCTPDAKTITIQVNRNIESLDVDVCDNINITGNCGNIKTQSGDVDINGNVDGNITTMSGDVDCGNVSGNITTMSGDVKHRR